MEINKETESHNFEHKQKIQEMLKVIQMCDIPEHIKIIMRTRIWGIHPDVFSPATVFQMAYLIKGGKLLKTGEFPSEEQIKKENTNIPTLKEERAVREIENTGIFNCQQFLLSQKSQDIVERYNKNFSKNNSHMFASTPFERKKFSV